MTDEDTRLDNLQIIARQMREVERSKYVTCANCNRETDINSTCRCLYCGIYYCEPCADIHFGTEDGKMKITFREVKVIKRWVEFYSKNNEPSDEDIQLLQRLMNFWKVKKEKIE